MSHDHPLDRLNRANRRDDLRQVIWYFIDERPEHATYCMAVSPDERTTVRQNKHLREVSHREYWAFARRIGGLKP